MIRFECDYGEGAAQPVLDLLQKTNLEQTPGYGEDEYCARARALVRRLCRAPEAGVHFLVGATQANLTVIDAALKPWQGVLCADSGHIHVHETGAVEATGHKCLVLPGTDGKITAAQVRAAFEAHRANPTHEHEVQPGMVYISNPTEWGTLYTKAELTALSEVCRACGLYLFLDGARMAYGLMSAANDLTLADIAALCDAAFADTSNAVDRYQEKTGGWGHRHVAQTDAAIADLLAFEPFEAEADDDDLDDVQPMEPDDIIAAVRNDEVRAALTDANQKLADFLKEETDKLLDSVLYTTSMKMKNGFHMSDF